MEKNFEYKENDFSRSEQYIIRLLEEAQRCVKGELELNQNEETNDWYALDYREELGQAFPIQNTKYEKEPFITDAWLFNHKVDLKKCLDYCHVAYVGDIPTMPVQRGR